MNRGINPTTPLREQHARRLRGHGMSKSMRVELGPECREMLEQQRRQETILAQREQILFVQSVDVGFSVFLDDTIGDDDGATFVGGSDTIKGETSWKTSHRAEQTFESLGHMMRKEVLVNLESKLRSCLPENN